MCPGTVCKTSVHGFQKKNMVVAIRKKDLPFKDSQGSVERRKRYEENPVTFNPLPEFNLAIAEWMLIGFALCLTMLMHFAADTNGSSPPHEFRANSWQVPV